MAITDSFSPIEEGPRVELSKYKEDLGAFFCREEVEKLRIEEEIDKFLFDQYSGSIDHTGEFAKMEFEIDKSVYFSEEKSSPFQVASLVVGISMGLLALIVAWKLGLNNLSLLVVYCAAGSAFSLGSTVVLTFLSHRTNYLDQQ